MGQSRARWFFGSIFLILVSLLRFGESAFAAAPFDKVFIVVFENENYSETLEQPFFAKLAGEGARFDQFFALAHPSYPNYIALTSGSTHGVRSDRLRTLDVPHLGDLLEAKGKSWKVYAEGYPEGCFLRSSSGKYVRRHVPFLSYKNVQDSKERCDRIVNASRLQSDLEKGRLPDVAFYIPDNRNNGHDTGVQFADSWFSNAFSKHLKDPRFTRGLLFVVTFDEDDWAQKNRIYTVFWGERVRPGSIVAERYDHYSLLRTIENAFGLGTLGLGDAKAKPISGIWR